MCCHLGSSFLKLVDKCLHLAQKLYKTLVIKNLSLKSSWMNVVPLKRTEKPQKILDHVKKIT